MATNKRQKAESDIELSWLYVFQMRINNQQHVNGQPVNEHGFQLTPLLSGADYSAQCQAMGVRDDDQNNSVTDVLLTRLEDKVVVKCIELSGLYKHELKRIRSRNTNHQGSDSWYFMFQILKPTNDANDELTSCTIQPILSHGESGDDQHVASQQVDALVSEKSYFTSGIYKTLRKIINIYNQMYLEQRCIMNKRT